ncbi:putative Ntn-hydrolase superfamily protein [Neorhizobium sp. 2083]|uniref:DUF1028 domain-containing protein n=1 Tax=Neorhizobium sp. 2083 TaxID=2817762 RepID=UPI00285EC33A|nr:DUF1028 domain-containing protein [Neorhizobium sp. 2083]MDR6819992.1 putative Ntn-hydrolase superfamily protein [Neorhizobium sp. 2083]
MTFSISARCSETGAFGIAISSSSPAVAARCAHVKAGAGVITSQNVTDPSLGLLGLELLAGGRSAAQVRGALVASTPFADFRQIAVIDRSGATAAFSGKGALGVHGIAEGQDCIAAGNLLMDRFVLSAMVEAFEQSRGFLAERLMVALKAGQDAGGEAGPVYSAGVKVARELDWPVVDLRVDWSEQPIEKLFEIWRVYEPQMEDYVRRAVAPEAAPSFGVPGDE